MKSVIFQSMLKISIRDKISLFYAIVFPTLLMIVLDSFFHRGGSGAQIVTAATAIGAMFWGMQGIAFPIFSQRIRGVYKLLNLTPVSIASFIFMMAAARTAAGVILNLAIWMAGMLYFQLSITFTSVIWTTLVLIAASLCFACFGVIAGNFASNEGQVNMICNLIQLPIILMSDAFYSLQHAPEWLQIAANLLPFGYFTKALTGAITGDQQAFLLGIFILSLYTVISFIFSCLTFKWEEEGHLVRRSGKQSTE